MKKIMFHIIMLQLTLALTSTAFAMMNDKDPLNMWAQSIVNLHNKSQENANIHNQLIEQLRQDQAVRQKWEKREKEAKQYLLLGIAGVTILVVGGFAIYLLTKKSNNLIEDLDEDLDEDSKNSEEEETSGDLKRVKATRAMH